MSPEFLYFDLGNVLVRFCNDRMCRQMAEVAGVPVQGVRRVLYETDTASNTQWRFEAGELSADEYFDFFCRTTNSHPDREELERAASDIFTPIGESFQLVERLAASGHRLGILSNTNAVHWAFLTDGRWPALNEAFEVQVTSFDAKSMKPDRRIFDYAAEKAGVALDEMFFVDDREENVAGARAVGIDAVRFTSTRQLVVDLHQRGVKTGHSAT